MEAVIGNGVTTTQQFRSTSGTLTDPSTVTLVVREPDGTRVTLVYGTDVEVVRLSAGIYSFSHTPDQTGRYGYRWVGTGTVAYAEEQFITITPSQVLA